MKLARKEYSNETHKTLIIIEEVLCIYLDISIQ